MATTVQRTSLNEANPVGARLAAYVNSEEYSDVQFLVGPEQERFFAHKVIIAAASVFFKQLFFESVEEKPASLIISLDVRSDAFLRLLEFCYTGSVQLGDDYSMLLELLGLANRFAVVSLLRVLLEHIENEKSVVSLIGMDVVETIRRKYFPDETRPRSISASAVAVSSVPNHVSPQSASSTLSPLSQAFLSVNSANSTGKGDTDGSFDDAFDESGSDVIQYNSTKKQVEFSEKILRRIKVAKQKIEQQARKMKPDEGSFSTLCISTALFIPIT